MTIPPGGERDLSMPQKVGQRYGSRPCAHLPSAPVQWAERGSQMLGVSARYVESLRERHVREASVLMLVYPPVLRERYQREMGEALALAPATGGLTDQLSLDTIREMTDAINALAPLVGEETAAQRRAALRELEQAIAVAQEHVRAIKEVDDE